MSNEIDIRTMAFVKVDKIVFGDGNPHGADVATYVDDSDGDGWCYINEENCGDSTRVMYSDIDNLILALRKAKELWAK